MKGDVVRTKVALIFLALFGLIVGGCSMPAPKAEAQQMAEFVAELKQAGFTIDKVTVTQSDGRTVEVENTGWETEDADKTRNIGKKKRPQKIAKGTRVMEVVLVLAGDCKVEFEKPKDGYTHYFDEGRDAQAKELAVAKDFDIIRPTRDRMHEYVTKRDEYNFCEGKPLTVSTVKAGS